MKKLLFVFIGAVSLLSCSKEERVDAKDYVGNTYVTEVGEGIYYLRWAVAFVNESEVHSSKTRIAPSGDTFTDFKSYTYHFNGSDNIFTCESRALPPKCWWRKSHHQLHV